MEEQAELATPKAAETAKQEHTWTDAEHDAYVKARIDKQNARHADALAERDARIAELEKAAKDAQERADKLTAENQRREWAEQASKETGVPASILRGDTLEELQAHAAEIANAMPKQTAPVLNDGGGKKNTPQLTRDEIAALPARERLEAIKANPELCGI